MYEYAVTRGSGTLVDYGVCGDARLQEIIDVHLGWSDAVVLVRWCSPRCETGR